MSTIGCCCAGSDPTGRRVNQRFDVPLWQIHPFSNSSTTQFPATFFSIAPSAGPIRVQWYSDRAKADKNVGTVVSKTLPFSPFQDFNNCTQTRSRQSTCFCEFAVNRYGSSSSYEACFFVELYLEHLITQTKLS